MIIFHFHAYSFFFFFFSRLSHQHMRQRKEQDSPLMKKAQIQGLQKEMWKFLGPEIARQSSRKRRQPEKASEKRRKKQHSCFLLRNCNKYKHFLLFPNARTEPSQQKHPVPVKDLVFCSFAFLSYRGINQIQHQESLLLLWVIKFIC